MRERLFAVTMLAVCFCGLAIAAGMSPLTQHDFVARTDLQAQVLTAAEVRDLGTAMFSWLTDQVGAAAAGQSQVPRATLVQMSSYPPITHVGLTSLLVPQYLQEVPELDGWNHPYELYLNVANPLAQQVMAIRSPGRNGQFSGSSYTVAPIGLNAFEEDIVWADGFSVRWPQTSTRRGDREAQRQTVRTISHVATAMFYWLTDQVGLAAGGTSEAEAVSVVNLGSYVPISHAALRQVLEPQYMIRVPEHDGWGSSLEYYLNVGNPLAANVMAIRSPGRNKAQETNTYTVTSFESDEFDQDIVWADGFSVRWPQAVHGLPYYTVAPCRVIDTRSGSALQSGVSQRFELGAACDIPAESESLSVAVTVTVVGATGDGYVTLFRAGTPVPEVSTINFAAGQMRSNNAVVRLSGDVLGALEAQATVAGGGQVHLIVDVNGYWD